MLELDGEQLWLTELVAGRAHRASSRSSARGPRRCCSSTTPGASSTTIPGTRARDLAPVPRPRSTPRRPTRCCASAATATCGLSTTASCTAAPTRSRPAAVAAYHLIPAGGSRSPAVALPHARARLRARGDLRVGDSREDLAVAAVVGSLLAGGNALARDPSMREAIGAHDERARRRGGTRRGRLRGSRQHADGLGVAAPLMGAFRRSGTILDHRGPNL